MSQRKTALVLGEHYHIYNRGVDKRSIFEDPDDVRRFLKVMEVFNTRNSVGSLYEYLHLKKSEGHQPNPLIEFVAYCLNPNHYHFILSPLVEKGVEQFMQRLGTGYTMYFNNKYERSGALFQGVFKSSHIDSNEYLLRVSAYVNLNNRAHQLGGLASKLVRSSWDEYVSSKARNGFCNKEIVLSQFASPKEYSQFALSALKDILLRKQEEKDLQKLLID